MLLIGDANSPIGQHAFVMGECNQKSVMNRMKNHSRNHASGSVANDSQDNAHQRTWNHPFEHQRVSNENMEQPEQNGRPKDCLDRSAMFSKSAKQKSSEREFFTNGRNDGETKKLDGQRDFLQFKFHAIKNLS